MPVHQREASSVTPVGLLGVLNLLAQYTVGNGHVAAEPWHGLVLNVCRTGTGTFSWQLGVCAAGFDR